MDPVTLGRRSSGHSWVLHSLQPCLLLPRQEPSFRGGPRHFLCFPSPSDSLSTRGSPPPDASRSSAHLSSCPLLLGPGVPWWNTRHPATCGLSWVCVVLRRYHTTRPESQCRVSVTCVSSAAPLQAAAHRRCAISICGDLIGPPAHALHPAEDAPCGWARRPQCCLSHPLRPLVWWVNEEGPGPSASPR